MLTFSCEKCHNIYVPTCLEQIKSPPNKPATANLWKGFMVKATFYAISFQSSEFNNVTT